MIHVPFVEMRPRLQQVLEKLKLMALDRSIDDIVGEIDDIIQRCTTTYLARLPERIELVILLGTNLVDIRTTTRFFEGRY